MKKQIKQVRYDVFSKYRNILMGFSTLSVLFFHYTDDLRIYEYNFDGILKLFNIYISSSGVDIFLFLSGLGLYYAWKKNSDYKSFISKRFKRILIPYLLISIPAYIIREVFLRETGWLSVLKGVSFYSFITKGDTWHWYILMSVLCYLAFPWIYEIVEENNSKIKVQTTMLGVLTFITTVAIVLQEYDTPSFKILNIMLLRIPVFVFGAFIGRASYEKRIMGKEWIAFGVICLICLPLRDTNRLIIVRYLVGAINLFALLLIVKVFEYLEQRNLKLTFLYKSLDWFGRYSLEIYLLHVTVRSIMINLGYYTYEMKNFLLELLFTFVLAIIVKRLTNLILKLIEPKEQNLKA